MSDYIIPNKSYYNCINVEPLTLEREQYQQHNIVIIDAIIRFCSPPIYSIFEIVFLQLLCRHQFDYNGSFSACRKIIRRVLIIFQILSYNKNGCCYVTDIDFECTKRNLAIHHLVSGIFNNTPELWLSKC
jgi:hypothetical protein